MNHFEFFLGVVCFLTTAVLTLFFAALTVSDDGPRTPFGFTITALLTLTSAALSITVLRYMVVTAITG